MRYLNLWRTVLPPHRRKLEALKSKMTLAITSSFKKLFERSSVLSRSMVNLIATEMATSFTVQSIPYSSFMMQRVLDSNLITFAILISLYGYLHIYQVPHPLSDALVVAPSSRMVGLSLFFSFSHCSHFSIGYNDNPIARRVKSLPSDYFLLTNRFLCDPQRKGNPGCGTSWQGTDPHIIAQLPRRLSVAFPGKIATSPHSYYF